MEKLTNALTEINQNFGKKAEILRREYSRTNLLDIWTMEVPSMLGKEVEEWVVLLDILQVVLKLNFPNENSFNATVSKFRKPLRASGVDAIYKKSLIHLGRSQKESVAQKKKYKDSVTERNENRGSFPVIYVEDVIEKITALIESEDIYENAVAVMLATQSRAVELFKVSEYSIFEDLDHIKITGLAKGSPDAVITKKLVGLNSYQVIKGINKIRSLFDFKILSNEDVLSVTNASLNKAFKAHIHPLFSGQDEEYLKGVTCHKTRYIGAYVSYLLYGKPTNIPEVVYTRSILGHVSADSTLSYLGINVQFKTDAIKDAPEHIKKIIEELQNEIKEVKANAVRPPVQGTVDLAPYKNKYNKATKDEKIENGLQAMRALKAASVKMTQHQLRDQLKYSGSLMTIIYQKAREEGII